MTYTRSQAATGSDQGFVYTEDPDNIDIDNSDYIHQQASTRSGTAYAKNRQAQYAARDWVEDNKESPVQKWNKQVMPHSNFKALKWVKSGTIATASQPNNNNNNDVIDDDSSF